MAKLSEETKKAVVEIICEELCCTEDSVEIQSHLVTDLGADELDVLELILTIEDAFGIGITEEDASKIGTVEDLMNTVERLTSKQ